MTYRKLHRGLLLLAGLCVAQVSHAGDEQAEVSVSLYPATKAWTLISESPAVSSETLKTVRGKLLNAYKSSNIGDAPLESPNCSFVKRALEAEDISPFHSIDVDGDGVLDVVYAGSAQCAEGDATVVWFGTKEEGFTVRQHVLWNVRALRVSPNAQTISSVAVGCCGDPVDQYFLGNLENMRRFSRTRVAQETVQPKVMLGKALPFKSVVSTSLRSAPVRVNHYDKNRSEFMAHAIFGNVLRRYLPGASGLILAEQTDGKGKPWYFVVFSEESDAFLLQAPYAVDAGWVDRADLTNTVSQCQQANRACEKNRAGR